jgi:bifunctional DNA-binding transcriptional regulator/antitoxin component of YhaV-PrlF toxin-antitoxin module
MPKVSSKRQITLPIEQCQEPGIKSSDEFQSFVADGHITIIKKQVARIELCGIRDKRGSGFRCVPSGLR